MAPPTQLVINMIPNSVSNSVSVLISPALQSLDSSGACNSVDQSVRNIFRAGTFVDTQGRWWNASQILYITAS